ncbi:MAG: DUF4835 family protein [Bacteroidetes bacterium]|nr:DUF4835 family protein [Bacteroidota bacterium]
MKKIMTLLLILSCSSTFAQELNCKVLVMTDQIQGVEPKVFKTLQQAMGDFVNTRKWGSDNFETKERIECVFTLILNKQIDGIEGGYQGKLNIQANRPIFNSNYSSTMVNYIDNDVTIKYIEYQALDFNDTRIAGNDPLEANLTATLAYYCYLITGLDYDSYSLKGGSEFYAKAQNIVNNAPEHKLITGWKPGENQRNRYWLIDQTLNSRFSEMRTVFYNYHRLGLDVMTTDEESARNTINAIFPVLERINSENPSSQLMRFFFYAKADEIQNYLAKTAMADKQKFVPMLTILDVMNAGKYLALLK